MPVYTRMTDPASYYMQRQQNQNRMFQNMLNLVLTQQQRKQQQQRWEQEQALREKGLEYDKMRAEAYTGAQKALEYSRKNPTPTSKQIDMQLITQNPYISDTQKWQLLSGADPDIVLGLEKDTSQELTLKQKLDLASKKRTALEPSFKSSLSTFDSIIKSLSDPLADLNPIQALKYTRALEDKPELAKDIADPRKNRARIAYLQKQRNKLEGFYNKMLIVGLSPQETKEATNIMSSLYTPKTEPTNGNNMTRSEYIQEAMNRGLTRSQAEKKWESLK